MLVFCGSSPPLLDLVRGAAANLDLEFREVSGVEQICDLRGTRLSIAVVVLSDLSDGLWAVMRRASVSVPAWFIVVMGNMSSHDTNQAIEAGAVACLDTAQAMVQLAYLIRNLLRCVQSDTDAVPTELPVSGDVALRVPEHVLVSGRQDYHLTPIGGRLLEYLARHVDALSSTDELKRSGWGTSRGVSDHALHQHMHHLRGVLHEYGLGDRLNCRRGKGYVLTGTKPKEPDD